MFYHSIVRSDSLILFTLILVRTFGKSLNSPVQARDCLDCGFLVVEPYSLLLYTNVSEEDAASIFRSSGFLHRVYRNVII
jgi:hypothetical protein